MHILVIGAGVSGLCSAKRLFDAGFETTIYEKSNEIGGTWVYTDDIDSPETGVRVHTSMYRNLRINIPKEVSYLPGFPFPEQDTSFVTHIEMLDYIRKYADHFNIKEKITFQHEVIRVTPFDETKWEVIVHNIKQNKFFTKIFDAVMICNGHYSTPFFSPIPGHADFKGKIIHSHNFRRGEIFQNQNVLIIGAGSSGQDISVIIAKHVNTVTLSHRKTTLTSLLMPSNLIQKPIVKRFTENGAEFIDGTYGIFDTICYCTGYTTKFPFLSVDSELTTDQNHVRPLYKHTVNINKPTMAFIGLPAYYSPIQAYDLQARFVIKHWSGGKQFPSQQEMLDDMDAEDKQRKSFGLNKRNSHNLGYREDAFYNELAKIADIAPLKPVYLMIFQTRIKRHKNDFIAYRNDRYRIIDDTNFVRISDGVEYMNN